MNNNNGKVSGFKPSMDSKIDIISSNVENNFHNINSKLDQHSLLLHNISHFVDLTKASVETQKPTTDKKVWRKKNSRESSPLSCNLPFVETNYGNSSKSFVPTCYHCGKIGHIRSRCNLLRKKSPNYRKVKTVCPTTLMQGELREHMKSTNKTAMSCAIPVGLKTSNHKYIWVRKSSHLPTVPHTGD